MGRGSYTAADWANLRSSKQLHSQQTVASIFPKQQAHTGYLSSKVHCRYSCDPDAFQNATPVIIGFDTTASMGYLAKELATNSIHNVVTALLSGQQISSPQVLCAAIGDCKSDLYPLQVTQFEADIRIVQQLLDLHLEGGGGGNNGESYNLLWYFAAYHTQHDHWKKREQKGYLFTIGDDRCHSGLSVAEINKNFYTPAVYAVSNEELIEAAREKYHIFHIHIEQGSPLDDDIFHQWCQLLPGCSASIHKKDIACLSDLITAIIGISSGLSHNEALRQLDPKKAERIARSVVTIHPPKNTNIISF